MIKTSETFSQKMILGTRHFIKSWNKVFWLLVESLIKILNIYYVITRNICNTAQNNEITSSILWNIKKQKYKEVKPKENSKEGMRLECFPIHKKMRM